MSSTLSICGAYNSILSVWSYMKLSAFCAIIFSPHLSSPLHLQLIEETSLNDLIVTPWEPVSRRMTEPSEVTPAPAANIPRSQHNDNAPVYIKYDIFDYITLYHIIIII